MAEKDPEFEGYQSILKRRYGLNDTQIGMGHMRGSEPDWAKQPPGQIPHTPGTVRIVVVQETATLSGEIPPSAVPEMLAEWERQLRRRSHKDIDERQFTREMLSKYLALNRHRQEDAAAVLLSGAIWLAVTDPQTRGAIKELVALGDVGVHYDVAFDDKVGARSFQLSVVDYSV